MLQNTLSGNSISNTYQSVLQLNLKNKTYDNIKDGLGANSILNISPILSVPIKIDKLIYPSPTPAYENTFLFKDSDSEQIQNIVDFKEENDDILFKNIAFNIDNITTNTSSIITLNGTVLSGSNLSYNQFTIKYGDYNEGWAIALQSASNSITFSNPSALAISKLWITAGIEVGSNPSSSIVNNLSDVSLSCILYSNSSPILTCNLIDNNNLFYSNYICLSGADINEIQFTTSNILNSSDCFYYIHVPQIEIYTQKVN